MCGVFAFSRPPFWLGTGYQREKDTRRMFTGATKPPEKVQPDDRAGHLSLRQRQTAFCRPENAAGRLRAAVGSHIVRAASIEVLRWRTDVLGLAVGNRNVLSRALDCPHSYLSRRTVDVLRESWIVGVGG
ncbi:hypothetical protein Trydic_g21165 [Trypoxylus dichotomus]